MKLKNLRKKENSTELNTSALPDIIFMLLFFFMVVTVLRKHTVKLKYELPEAENLEKLYHKSLISHIYLGDYKTPDGKSKTKIQINDAFVDLEEIESAIRKFKSQVPEKDQPKVTVSLNADQGLNMGFITKVKFRLREAEQYKLLYAAESNK